MWLPETTRSELARDRQEVMEMVAEVAGVSRHFTTALRSIDPNLELVKAKDSAALMGLKPGYWHVIRKGTPCDILPLEDGMGNPREPGSWMFDWLNEQDLWNERAVRANKERQRRLTAAREKEREREREQRIAEADERWKRANSTQISVPRAV